MRTIKFRAWDKQANIMWDWKNLKALSFLGIEKEPYLELMQFTGLLDKNGKEIYEGDIINAEEPTFESGIYSWQVEWMNAGFVCRAKETTTLEPLFAFSDFEVIGNIYENSGLLS